MWHSPEGDRIVRGAEAMLVREVAATIVDELITAADWEDGMPLQYGIPPWDQLTISQQVALLDDLLHHLLDGSSDPPPLTAIHEGAIGAIFDQALSLIEIEIDIERDLRDQPPMLDEELTSEPNDRFPFVTMRQLVLRAYYEAFEHRYPKGHPLPESWLTAIGLPTPFADGSSVRQWHAIIDDLADRLLWDRDYLMSDSMLDAAPALAEPIRRRLGIEENYFRAIAPDIGDEDLPDVLQRLRSLTHPK
jgi:hypothetical protein